MAESGESEDEVHFLRTVIFVAKCGVFCWCFMQRWASQLGLIGLKRRLIRESNFNSDRAQLVLSAALTSWNAITQERSCGHRVFEEILFFWAGGRVTEMKQNAQTTWCVATKLRSCRRKIEQSKGDWQAQGQEVRAQEKWISGAAGMRPKRPWPPRNELAKGFSGVLYQFSTVGKTSVTNGMTDWLFPRRNLGCATEVNIRK